VRSSGAVCTCTDAAAGGRTSVHPSKASNTTTTTAAAAHAIDLRVIPRIVVVATQMDWLVAKTKCE